MPPNDHAPLDSPNFSGTPTAPTPGINDTSNRLATTAFVQAQKQPLPGNQPISLLRDGAGRGTSEIAMEVTGLRGRRLTSDPPADTEIYVWNQQTTTWELKRSEEIGVLPGGASGQVQVNDGTGQLKGVTISGDATLNTTTGIETVTGLQGRPVAPTSPSDLQVLTWHQAAGRWEPGIGVGTGIGIPGGATGSVQINAGGGNFQGIVIGGDATLNTTTGVEVVRGLQGRNISAVAPTDGYVLTWVQASNLWTPAAPTGGTVSLDSPAFTGNPTAPTPAPGDNDTSLATTAFVNTAIAGAGHAPLASPAFTGNPTGPTPAPGDNDTSLATTAFVSTAIAAVPFTPLNSPIFTGDPRAPTPATADNDTSIATTAFVKAQGYLTGNQTITVSGDASGSGTTAIALTLQTVNSGVGTFAVQTVNGKGLTTAAGNMTGDVTTVGAVATLATVNANVGTFQGLTVNGKGLVTAAADQGYLTASVATTTYAPLASPVLTGDPRAPTPATADNDTSIATTAFVKAQGYQTVNSTITLTGDVTGSGTASFATTVTGLRGRNVSATAPTDTQVLTWSSGNNQWQPGPPTGSSVTVGGLNTQVQYNNASAFGGSAGLTLNATQVTSLTPGLGSDATGDIYYRAASGLLTRLGIGSAGTVLQVASGLPAWQPLGGGAAVGSGTGPQIAQYPTGTSSSVGAVTISGDATLAQGGALTLAATAITPGTYQGIQFDQKGRAIAASDQAYLTAALAASTYAPLANPTLTGNPTAPTPAPGDNDTSIATTAFVGTALASFAPLASPALTGNPTAPTPAAGDADTSIATTAFVAASFLTNASATATYAPLVSPIFTGDPRAPTPATADNDTSVATTAYVKAQGYLVGNQTITLIGDITGSGATGIATTLPTVNSNVGVFAACNINGKGLAIGGAPLSGDVTTAGAVATLAASGVVAGTYHGIQYDAKGRAIAATPTSYVTTDTPSVNLTATGTDRASGLALTSRLNEVLTTAAGTGVVLPSFMTTPGESCTVIAYGASDLRVYPLTGQSFRDGGVDNGADQPVIIRTGNVATYRSTSATRIYRVSGT